MTARAEILAQIDAALAARPDSPEILDRSYRTQSDDGIDIFITRLESYGARTSLVSETELGSLVSQTLREAGVRRVVAPQGIPKEWLSGITPLLDSPPLDYETLDDADAVITTCKVAIAQSGTIVLDGTAGMGRRVLSLLPDHHVCVVRASQIVGSLPEALGSLEPSAPLTFISGPSATVDIEMTRIAGVHGPRTLTVLVATP